MLKRRLPLAALGLLIVVGAVALVFYAAQGQGGFSLRPLAQLLPPPPPSTQYTLRLTSPGWNFVSIPLVRNILVVQNGCGSVTLWHYDPVAGQYLRGSGFESMVAGAGYFVNVPAACDVSLQGDSGVDLEGTQLGSGWNQVGAPFTTVTWDANVQGSCAGKITSGPWKYNSNTRAYEAAGQLEPGNGYWVKLSEACALGSAGPPLPPQQQFVGGTVTPTPTPTPKTGCMCTQEYAPVCGTDGKTYGNKCTASCANVPAAYVGECKTASPTPTATVTPTPPPPGGFGSSPVASEQPPPPPPRG